MKKLISYFKKPYPVSENPWRTIVFISLFVSLFLVIFHPFGSGGIDKELRNYILVGYGGVTFIILVINLIIIPLLFKKQFAESTWTLGKQILWLCWILFTIGLGNYYYSHYMLSINISFIRGLIIMQVVTLLVGIFPIVIVTFITYNRSLKRNLSKAIDLDAQLLAQPKNEPTETRLILLAENEKNSLDLLDNQVIFISSEGNYSTVFYMLENQIKKTVLRSTLSRMEEQMKLNPKLFRCHRAFIVNMHHIEKVKGNSQGLQLKLTGDFEIPVSRNFAKEFKERIQHIK